MKTVIEMAREAGYMKTVQGGAEVSMASMDCLERFAELVRADERNSRAHSLGYGEMELSLQRNHKDYLFECRRRFSAQEVMYGPDFMVEATASNLEVEMDRVIREWSNT